MWCVARPDARTAGAAVATTPNAPTRVSDPLLVAPLQQEALATGCQGKLPKCVAACVDVLLQALRAFGVRIIKPTPLMRCVASLVDHKDGAVREGAKEVAVRTPRPAVDCAPRLC